MSPTALGHQEHLVQFTYFPRQRMLTFDAMTSRMEVCGEQDGAGTNCVHHRGDGSARDLLPLLNR